MSRRHLNLLVDTNVWLDYLLGRKEAPAATALLEKALENDDVLAITPTIAKDIFFLVGAAIKRSLRADGLPVTEKNAAAANEVAWSCLRTVQAHSIMLGVGFGEHLEAMALRGQHGDYEDDLLLAIAQGDAIDYLVTNDKKLLGNKAAPAITPQEYMSLR